MWFIAIHFDGPYVDGYICPNGATPEEAIVITKKKLIQCVHMLKHKISLSNNDNIYAKRDLESVNSKIRSLKKPWRKTKRNGDPVVKVIKVDYPVRTTYWPLEIITQEHVVNIGVQAYPH